MTGSPRTGEANSSQKRFWESPYGTRQGLQSEVMDQSEIPAEHPALRSYMKVAVSFLHGLVRLTGSEAVHYRLVSALRSFRNSGRLGFDGLGQEAVSHLTMIQPENLDCHIYVSDLSHLIYATSLLDTFLSETTLFLFLLHPLSMGKNQQVPLRMVIDAHSRNETLTEAARTRTREISYLPFLGRLQFLRDTFGLEIVLGSQAEESLEHYSSVRNTAVHDQGVFELSLAEDGCVMAKQKTCAVHPSKITADDVDRATNSYRHVASLVSKAVFSQVLKADGHPAVAGLTETIVRADRVSPTRSSPRV